MVYKPPKVKSPYKEVGLRATTARGVLPKRKEVDFWNKGKGSLGAARKISSKKFDI